ncbi:hypothetical protein [Niveibacterium sp. SC-1]|uniref:hypothetical protein n=1 Tax=Niveibacterium sp. SC-1 TaxID=3135646 RepID=UPI00311DFB73
MSTSIGPEGSQTHDVPPMPAPGNGQIDPVDGVPQPDKEVPVPPEPDVRTPPAGPDVTHEPPVKPPFRPEMDPPDAIKLPDAEKERKPDRGEGDLPEPETQRPPLA